MKAKRVASVLTTAIAAAIVLLMLAPTQAVPVGTAWSMIKQGHLPTSAFVTGDSAMTYDPSVGVLVLSHGYLFVMSGTTWHPITTNGTPMPKMAGGTPQCVGDGLAYDPVDNYTVLFGGSNCGVGTWVLQGFTWTNILNASASPPNREFFGLTWDAANGSLLMFGGLSLVPALGTHPADLSSSWTFVGGNWTNITKTVRNAPTPRQSFGMTYDSSTGSVVLFGGCTVGASGSVQKTYNVTYSYSGHTWSKVSSSTVPPARSGGQLAYDPVLGGDVLFGGMKGSTHYNDTWILSNGTWTNLNLSGPPAFHPTTSPVAPLRPMTYDSALGAVVVAVNIPYLSIDTWLLT